MKIKNKKRLIIAVIAVISAVLLLFALVSALTRDGRVSKTGEELSTDTVKDAERLNFLLLGCDRASGLTDVMMLVSVDTDGKSMNILQIPRDTYARYSERSYKKLNGAMAILGGPDRLCGFISETMGADIDGYFVFTLDAFVKAVNAVGGVEIELPFDMDYHDPYQGLSIHLDAGMQTLDGEAAEKFVRYRSGYVRGDLGRMDAQKLFMAAFIKKVTDTLSATSAVRILSAVAGEIETDLSLGEMTELALTALDIKSENITMMTLAGEDIRIGEDGPWYYVLSRSAAEEAVRKYANADVDFDGNSIFSNPDYEEIERIYRSDIPLSPSTASDISQNGIGIPKH